MSDSPKVLTCPKCSAAVRAGQQMAGSRVRCPSCDNSFKVPGVIAAANDDDDWFDLSEPLDRSKPVSTSPRGSAAKPLPKPSGQPAADSGVTDFDETDSVGHDSPSDPFASETDAESDFDPFSIPLPAAEPRRSSTSIDDWLGADDLVPDVLPEVPETEFRFPCPICDSAHYAIPSQTGAKIKCGDCTSMIIIPDPPKVVPKYNPPMDTVAPFALRESLHRPDRQDSPFQKSAADLLRSAESAEIDEDLDKLYENPDVAAWFRDVFAVFANPKIVMQLAILTGICSAALIAWYFVADYGVVVKTAVGLPAGIVAGGVLGMRFLAIMQQVFGGEEETPTWPYANTGGPLQQGFMVLAAGVLASLPGQLIGSMLGEPFTLFWGVFVLLSVWGLTPVLLLSMLDNGTVFGPYSKNVIDSFERCMEPWGGMYFSSGLFFFAYFMLLVAPPSGGIVKAVIMAFGLVALAIIVAPMLGKVALAIVQTPVKSKPKSE